jgi:tRNA threonylcarbamoyladenosine biosynthesis protein TsaE
VKIHLPDAKATEMFGQKLGATLPPGAVILLRGDLGAGKTTLVQGIGLGLGIEEPIVSPTFTLVCEYFQGRIPLYHLDLYRLEGAEVENLYLENYWEGIDVPLGITAIEWAERLPYRPPNYLDLELLYLPDYSRQAVLQPVGAFPLDLEQFRGGDRG